MTLQEYKNFLGLTAADNMDTFNQRDQSYRQAFANRPATPDSNFNPANAGAAIKFQQQSDANRKRFEEEMKQIRSLVVRVNPMVMNANNESVGDVGLSAEDRIKALHYVAASIRKS